MKPFKHLFIVPMTVLLGALSVTAPAAAQTAPSSQLHVGIRLLRSCDLEVGAGTATPNCSAGVPRMVVRPGSLAPTQVNALTPTSPQIASPDAALTESRFATVVF